MNYWMEPLVVTGVILAAAVVTILGLVGGIDYLDCRGFAKGTGIETQWSWGCYAKVDGQWIPKQYVFGTANEIRLKDGRKK